MKIYPSASLAIQGSKAKLLALGKRVNQQSWQSMPSPGDTISVLNESFQFAMPNAIALGREVKPNLPWAEEHFWERVSGIPYNPPPSHVNWPYAQKDNQGFIKDEKFSHTYPERIWPKYAERSDIHTRKPRKGIYFNYGDLSDVIKLLAKDPTTRQAYIPIWFPEDTGANEGQRVPCTLGYWVIQREGYLHMTYYIRSCDIVRHFRDDIYLAIKLAHWIIKECARLTQQWEKVYPGTFTMHIGDLHCFYSEYGLLGLSKT